ncbi:cyclin-dependent kinase inhibitor 7-like [Bidens hawaiensis]|uniref:cyclin-dependent kinase inhibitor 7-like n=1 Tax=Bidens hawaiensis TaxID=980011 RepID=UPI00404AE767
MEPSISHGTVRHRSANSDAISPSAKRRKIDCQADKDNDSQLQIQSQRDADVSFQKNVESTAESGTSDHVNSSSFINSVNDDSISDLKAVCLPETESFMSVNGGFRDTSASTVVCLETEEIESVSLNEATSRRKPPAPAADMPSAAELEEFFAKAEEYEQKRFAKKYNYDIVKDVPIEGRYQWVRLKP